MQVFYWLLVIFYSFALSAQSAGTAQPIYRDQHRSLILWDQVNVNEWSDFELWKKQLFIKETTPQWELSLREKRLKEAVAIALQCIGSCSVETGQGNSSLRFRSKVFEEEDVMTNDQSYLWLYMLDGSLLRLSPSTSVTLKEINIGEDDIFFHVRVNYGNVFWMTRSPLLLKEDDRRETDSLFIPLDFYEANEETTMSEVDEANLVSLLEQGSKKKTRIPQLNKLIEANNSFAQAKSTWLLLVTPNISCFARNPHFEVVALTGGETYFKARENNQLGLLGPSDSYPFFVDYRGFRGEVSTELTSGQWHQISANGRDLGHPASDILQKLSIGEFPTRRIPSILIARELMLAEYSPFVFNRALDRLAMARDHGYRLWMKDPQSGESEIFSRINFLREYMRRLETTNLLASEKIMRDYKASRETVKGSTFTSNFYSRAVLNYLKRGDAEIDVGVDFRELNSTRRSLWKRMHAIR